MTSAPIEPVNDCYYWVREVVQHTLRVVAYRDNEYWAIGVPYPVEIDPRWIVARIPEPLAG